MLSAYINYPRPHATIHFDKNCAQIMSHDSSGRRVVKLTIGNLSDELERFGKKYYQFASISGKNDIWLLIDFQDKEFEVAILNHIIKLLGQSYTPFKGITPFTHC